MSSVNWLKIKNEYINGSVSYRKLAEKHGVTFSSLSKKAWAEKWAESRAEIGNKTETKLIQKTAEKIADAESDYIVDIAKLNRDLAGAVAGILTDEARLATLAPRDIKALTAALKDIKDIQSNVNARITHMEIDPLSKALEEMAGELDAD